MADLRTNYMGLDLRSPLVSLRSLADDQAQLERVIANGDVKVPAGASKEQEETMLRQAMNRPVDGGTTYVTGGDVSRFQRKSMPHNDAGKQIVSSMSKAFSGLVGAVRQKMGLPGESSVTIVRGNSATVSGGNDGGMAGPATVSGAGA